MKPFLFINPDGVLLVRSEHPDPFLGAGIAPYAAAFMQWATKNFLVRWLTDDSPARTFYLAERIGLRGHDVPYSSFGDSRTNALPVANEFYWMDTHLTPMDVSWLAQHNKTDRFLSVANINGVTENHRAWLAAKLNTKRT